MENSEYKTNQEISERKTKKTCYTIEDLVTVLDLSRNSIMKLMKQKEFFWLKLGNTYRIPQAGFDKWLNG